MRFLIITHTPHKVLDNQYYAYEPYVREMNLWIRYVEEVVIVAPLSKISQPSAIDSFYVHQDIRMVTLRPFDITTLANCLRSVIAIPLDLFLILKNIAEADHIHLRCPGNIGLLGVFSQVFFPSKEKTAKYAGNWNSYRGQPLSYAVQKKILKSEYLSRNIQVLAYTSGPLVSRNIVPFFTATYSENEIEPVVNRKLDSAIEFLFVGTLTSNKNPLKAAQLVLRIQNRAKVRLSFVGDGYQKGLLEDWVAGNELAGVTAFYGNISGRDLKELYKTSHFCILLSDSEGWPKAIAEAMFWGCIPIASSVSCIPWMLNYGKRGVLVDVDQLEVGCDEVVSIITNPKRYCEISTDAANWSRQFTLEKFESGITKFLGRTAS